MFDPQDFIEKSSVSSRDILRAGVKGPRPPYPQQMAFQNELDEIVLRDAVVTSLDDLATSATDSVSAAVLVLVFRVVKCDVALLRAYCCCLSRV